MMDRGGEPSDADLESLLKYRRLEDPRQARILRDVLAQVAPGPAPAPWWKLWRGRRVALGSSVAALAMATMVLVAVVGHRKPSVSAGWQARGDARSLALDVGCAGGSLEHCPQGSTLIFRAQVPEEGILLYAYADAVGPKHERIWYFRGVALPPAASDLRPVALRQGVRVGPEHAPGSYRLHLLLARGRLTPDAAVAQAAGTAEQAPQIIARQTINLLVVR